MHAWSTLTTHGSPPSHCSRNIEHAALKARVEVIRLIAIVPVNIKSPKDPKQLNNYSTSHSKYESVRETTSSQPRKFPNRMDLLPNAPTPRSPIPKCSRERTHHPCPFEFPLELCNTVYDYTVISRLDCPLPSPHLASSRRRWRHLSRRPSWRGHCDTSPTLLTRR